VAGAVVTFYQGLLFTGTTPGTVTGVTGAGALSSSLASAFSDNAANSATMSAAADSFANAIHACTQTVIVTHVAPSAVVGPLT
jgi:D-arabinose 1-dehydrogenase-like Zn-dependent alcohol dehydrogenase